jgi:hypothetical protein
VAPVLGSLSPSLRVSPLPPRPSLGLSPSLSLPLSQAESPSLPFSLPLFKTNSFNTSSSPLRPGGLRSVKKGATDNDPYPSQVERVYRGPAGYTHRLRIKFRAVQVPLPAEANRGLAASESQYRDGCAPSDSEARGQVRKKPGVKFAR